MRIKVRVDIRVPLKKEKKVRKPVENGALFILSMKSWEHFVSYVAFLAIGINSVNTFFPRRRMMVVEIGILNFEQTCAGVVVLEVQGGYGKTKVVS